MYSEEAHAILRRQRAALEQLGADNARLNEEVALEERALALQERRRKGTSSVGASVTAAAAAAAAGGGGKSPGSVVRACVTTGMET